MQLAPLAEEHGVTLAIKPMHAGCSAGCTFLNTVDDALAMLEMVNHPQVKLAVDTYHLGVDGGLESRLEEIIPHTAIVHVGDGRPPRDGEQDRCIPGQGDVPLAAILRGLHHGGYDGDFDIELMGLDIELGDYLDVIRRSKQWFDAVLGVSA